MEQAIITCDNIVKIYRASDADIEVVALQGLDLEARRGEIIALVGASGSGKTTLLNMLGALDIPSAGRCLVAGYDLTRLTERERDTYRRFVVGHVWQQSGRNLLADLSLEDNINLPQQLTGAPARQRARRTKALLERTNIAHLAHKKPFQTSGGEQQRAAICVALANQPAVLLADEPTGELDTMTAAEILALLRELNRELGMTTLIVTHDIAAASIADRTIAIRDGRTSTETVPREAPLANATGGEGHGEASAVIGLPHQTHREAILLDRTGRLQLPQEALSRIPFHGYAEVRGSERHVELWPRGTGRDTAHGGASAVIGLPGQTHHEAILLDRAGRLQLPQEEVARLPFKGRAYVLIREDHVEIWPLEMGESAATGAIARDHALRAEPQPQEEM